MPQETISFLDLEDKIRADTNGTWYRQWREELEDYGRTLQRQLDVGLAPDDYRIISQWRQSVTTAAEIINYVWLKFHPNLRGIP